MAFVFRTNEKENVSKPKTPGPGAYFVTRKHMLQKQQQSRAPFNNTSNRQIWQKNITPGPGSYQSQNIIKKEKKLLSDAVGQIVIYETPSESVAFKSKTMRFAKNNNSSNPGPGQYQTSPSNTKPLTASKKCTNTNQLRQFLKEKNKFLKSQFQKSQVEKQMIISANDDLDFTNEFLQSKQKCEEDKTKLKNSISFSSKVQRNIGKVRPQTSAGPGSYNILKSSFQIEKKHPKKSPVKSISIIKKNEKDQIQEIGPGYYELDQAFKSLNHVSLKKKKIQCFGSTVDRFQGFKTQNKMGPGPADYELIRKENKFNKNALQSGTSFGKEQRKTFQHPKDGISPFSYQTINDFSQLVKSKYNRKPSVKECFGSTKQRFQQKHQKKTQQNTSNCQLNLVVRQQDNSSFKEKPQNGIKLNNTFKTLLKNKERKKNFGFNLSVTNLKSQSIQSYRPLCYDSDFYTLCHKYGRKTQVQAPFMSCAQRFKDDSNTKYIELDAQKKTNQGSNNRETTKTSNSKPKHQNKGLKTRQSDRKIGWIATTKEQRFKQMEKKQKPLGPQYYNPSLPQKRSYNILFS